MKGLCFLVSYPTRWSLLFIFGSLCGSSKQQKNIVQLCTICFPTIEREKGLHRLEVDILISVYTKHIMHASETQKEPCHKPLFSRSRSLKANQERVKNFFAVWPVVAFWYHKRGAACRQFCCRTELVEDADNQRSCLAKRLSTLSLTIEVKSEKKIRMQPGEVAGLTHVGMEPRFGNQLKDKDRRLKHKENDKGSLRLAWREGWKIIQNL